MKKIKMAGIFCFSIATFLSTSCAHDMGTSIGKMAQARYALDTEVTKTNAYERGPKVLFRWRNVTDGTVCIRSSLLSAEGYFFDIFETESGKKIQYVGVQSSNPGWPPPVYSMYFPGAEIVGLIDIEKSYAYPTGKAEYTFEYTIPVNKCSDLSYPLREENLSEDFYDVLDEKAILLSTGDVTFTHESE